MIDLNQTFPNLPLSHRFTAGLVSALGHGERIIRAGGRPNAFWVLLFAAASVVAGFSPLPCLADNYRLSAHDKVKLRVVEWRQGEAQYKEWEALTGIYQINDGMISVPLGGEFVAEGKTTGELSKEIAQGLQKQTGVLKAPSVSVNVESYGSIYVIGDVQNAGAFPFSPHMTVLQAVSVAGGFLRKADAAFMRLDRDRIASSGELEEAELDYSRMLVRVARLEAELEGKDDFNLPVEFKDHPKASEITTEERRYMTSRSSMLKSKLDTLKDLQALNEQEIATLGDKIKSQHLQIDLSTEELKGVTSLFEKGLAVTSRQMTLKRELADAESKLLDLEIALVRSKQALKEAERGGEELRSAQIAEIQKDLQEARPKLEHAKVQMRTSALLINEATITTPAILAERENDVRPKPKFTIVREVKDNSERIVAGASTPLHSMDTIEVVTIDTQESVKPSEIPLGN